MRGATRSAIVRFSKEKGRQYSWREVHRSPFELLIAEILLRRTTATAVDRVYGRFLSQFPTPRRLDRASDTRIARALAGVGLQRVRARTLKRLARYLINQAPRSASVACMTAGRS